MIVDASALVAILSAESDASSLASRIEGAASRATHPISIYETVLALVRLNGGTVGEVLGDVEDFMADAEMQVVTIDMRDALTALGAFEVYGKGQHPAKLNMGDCFSYACAKVRGVPLLYKGDDFAKTDLAWV